MPNKPRIAFCFSGQARTLDLTYPFIKANIIDAAKEQGFDYDVFCVVEDDEDVNKVNLLNPISIEKVKSKDLDKIIEDKLEKKYKKEIFFSSKYFKNIMNKIYNQIYKIQRCLLLKTNFERKTKITYDLVFRLRYDIYFSNKLNYNNILNDIKKEKCIICNRVPNIAFIRAIQDFFFIWDGQQIKKIEETLFDNFDVFYDKFVDIRFLIIKSISKLCVFFYKLYKILVKKENKFIDKKIILGSVGPELLWYKFYLGNGFIIKQTNISFVLQRKDFKELCNFKKTRYEI